ncbi:MAG: hypothetical protein KatS3mg076_2688 [Candidatus Binatia bacterium]|nr:MAG: hypothetical protein KatS3mg076_2688 [Candidatus Binatia bacterium]
MDRTERFLADSDEFPRLVFVTGKGGVGKTTLAAALALERARTARTLLVEPGSGGLGRLFGRSALPERPARLTGKNLYGVRLDPARLLEEYFRSVVSIPFLTGRLLASRSFRALATAAPGVREFLYLWKFVEWAGSTKPRFETVVVDGPATGHALRLFSTPRSLASLVPSGPIGEVSRKALALIGDPRRTAVVLVTLADELAVTETIEAYRECLDDLVLRVTRPVLNRVYRRRFSASELALLAERGDHPLARAALFEAARWRETQRHVARLRRALGVAPLGLPVIFADDLALPELRSLGPKLRRLFRQGAPC